MLKSNAFNRNSKNGGAFGIDLGTTNSCISVVGIDGVSRTIPLEEGGSIMPSCVLWDGNKNKFIVGKEAYNQRYKTNACYSVKTLMGSDEIVHFKHGKKEITKTPVEVSSIILRALVDKVAYAYPNIKDVVITVPAAFNTKQIEDTRKAAELADLNVLSIIKEPTAASLAYRLASDENKTVLVYDLGGGTFDVSLVTIQVNKSGDTSDLFDVLGINDDVSDSGDDKTIVTVKDTKGNPHLGGDDLDKEMLRLFFERAKKQGLNPDLVSRVDKEKLLLKLESYKKKLDKLVGFNINLDLQLTDGSRFTDTVLFNSEDFIKATKFIYNKTKEYITGILDSSKVGVDTIVLIGGSTTNPELQRLIRKDFPNTQVCDYLFADEAVSLGAAINAKRVKYGSEDLEVFDVISQNIGVVADGRVAPIIQKGSSIPCTASKVLATVVDNQSQASIEIYEGANLYPEKCTYLGNLIVNDLPKGKAGSIAITIYLTVDVNGLLTIEVDSGKQKKEKATLVNVLGKKTVNDDNSNASIMFNKWYSYANSLQDEKERETLLNLIDQARVEPNKKANVVKYIRELSENA